MKVHGVHYTRNTSARENSMHGICLLLSKAAGQLDLTTATERAVQVLGKAENSGQPYAVLAGSFGTFVCLAALRAAKHRLLHKIVLWGPPPYLRCWEGFCRGRDEFVEAGSKKWIHISESFFEAIERIEFMLQRVRIPCVIASGSLDKYCQPIDVGYLRWVCRNNSLVRFATLVPEAGHEVSEARSRVVQDAYESALFGDEY
ncbi:MAG: hypothetical protein V5B34_06875 [Accumulibacter sp.]|jgi:pimeloyl-ACP methyl ester carboxylesterase